MFDFLILGDHLQTPGACHLPGRVKNGFSTWVRSILHCFVASKNSCICRHMSSHFFHPDVWIAVSDKKGSLNTGRIQLSLSSSFLVQVLAFSFQREPGFSSFFLSESKLSCVFCGLLLANYCLAKWCCLPSLHLAPAGTPCCSQPQPCDQAEQEMGHQET